MANGDTAAALGIPVVPPESDLRAGYDWINRISDKVAELLSGKSNTGHGHAATVITSTSNATVQGDLDALRSRIATLEGA